MDVEQRAAEVRTALARLVKIKNDAAVVTANVIAIAAIRGLSTRDEGECAAVTAAFTAVSRAVNDLMAESLVVLEGIADQPAAHTLHLVEQDLDAHAITEHQISQ